MDRRVASGVFVLLLNLGVAPLLAQRAEVSVGAGYTLSEGIGVDDRLILGVVYNKAEVNSGGSFNFTGGVYASPNMMVEFMYGRQSSKLTIEGPTGKADASNLSVDDYHVNFVYNWGHADARIRPFAFGGLGATNYSFGSLLLPNGNGVQIAGNTQFSTTWGAGAKFYFHPNIGAKFMVRYTPTYIKSDPAGTWCDPFYGCYVVGNPDYSNQFDTSGGVTLRF